MIPCPFLQKKGYCLKRDKCDFSHKNLPRKDNIRPVPPAPFFPSSFFPQLPNIGNPNAITAIYNAQSVPPISSSGVSPASSEATYGNPNTTPFPTCLLDLNKIPVRISPRQAHKQTRLLRNNTCCSNNCIKIHPENIQKSVNNKRAVPNVMLLNARLLVNKVNELEILKENYRADLLFVTETWSTDSVPDEVVNITGLNLV